jgi:hypothetical protein
LLFKCPAQINGKKTIIKGNRYCCDQMKQIEDGKEEEVQGRCGGQTMPGYERGEEHASMAGNLHSFAPPPSSHPLEHVLLEAAGTSLC